jgi:hypothetical protein
VQGERRPRRTELEVLLDRLSRRHFRLQAFRPDRHGPEVLAAVRKWGDCADVAIMFSEERALAYRVPTTPEVDVYAPERVLWWYAHKSVWTLRALLTLAPPGHPDAPDTLTPAPVGLGIPREARTPVTKPPSEP